MIIHDVFNKKIHENDTIKYIGHESIGGCSWLSDKRYNPVYKYTKVFKEDHKLWIMTGNLKCLLTPEFVSATRVKVQ